MTTSTRSSDTGHGGLPVFCKTADDWAWPEDRRFYLLTRNGPFICRDTPFFRSSAPAPRWRPDLALHVTSIALHYPPVPAQLFEMVVGFFAQVASKRPAEAVVLLTHHPQHGYDVLVPEQRSVVEGYATGRFLPVSVSYQVRPPPPGALLAGSIHSHPGPLGAFSSRQDADDAQDHFPGLHFVVGALGNEPPHLHCLFAVDGTVVEVAEPYDLVEGYARRSTAFPPEWCDRVTVDVVAPRPGHEAWPKHPYSTGGGRVFSGGRAEVRHGD